MASNRPIQILPATSDDVDALVDTFMVAFSDDYFQRVFPPTGPGQVYMRKAFQMFLRSRDEGRQEAQLSVVRDGDAVAAALLIWVVKDGQGGTAPWDSRWPPAGEGMDPEILREFFEAMQDQHKQALGEKPQIYLECLFTRPEYQRQGLGSALVAHACAIADGQGVATYLDAEAKAVGIYEKAGFRLNGDVERLSEMVSMTRPAKGE